MKSPFTTANLRKFIATLALLIAFIFAIDSGDAHAQTFPCSGPGPGVVVVGEHRAGPRAPPTPICQRTDQSGASAAPSGSGDDFSAVAWHDDANDVWASARHNSSGGAHIDAFTACRDVMGDGCKTMRQVNGYIMVSRDQFGDLFIVSDGRKKEARRRMAESCAKARIRCSEIGMFRSSDTYEDFNPQAILNRRHPRDLRNVRRSYAAAVRDTNRNEGFLATGHRTLEEAKAAALAACRNAEPGDDDCRMRNWSGSKVMVLYSDQTGQTYFETDFSPQAAAEALHGFCKQEQLGACRIERSFDVGVRGLHRYQTRIER